ncbi:HECT-domain-containing protein [Myxozyma melibiosi]|uniref:HECT-type E3 ubiquitin transferase n=1 Tax=Myxozyma melibiosi TaxID=54550 RepID=A0ABR1FDX1_9ASCO
MGGMMSELSMRFRDLFLNLKQRENPDIRMAALRELSILIIMSTEDMFSSGFSSDQIVRELVDIMSSPIYGEDDPESVSIACRCLANFMDSLPQTTRIVAYSGAVPVLCQKLLEVDYIDLAEQALNTLKVISADYPIIVAREGGLAGCLMFLDFFATSVQRTAVTIAANCSRNIPVSCFPTVRDVMPTLLNVLMGTDQKVVEQGCLSVARLIESFRHHPTELEELVSSDLLQKMMDMMIPGPSNVVGPSAVSYFLKALSFCAKASPELSATMLKMGAVDILYQILTGVSAPAESQPDDQASSIFVMQAVIHCPKDQILATLNVICELLPGIQKEDLAESPTYMETMDMLNFGTPEANAKRAEILKTCQPQVRRFVKIFLPVLLDVYSCTADLNVRQKVVTAFLRMFLNIDGDILYEGLKTIQFSSLLASIIAQKEQPSIVVAGLLIADVLRRRFPNIYETHFEREGVMAEIERLAENGPGSNAGMPEADADEGTDCGSEIAIEERYDDEETDYGHEDEDERMRDDDNEGEDEDGDEDEDEEEEDGEEEEEKSKFSSMRNRYSSSDLHYRSSLESWISTFAQKFLEKYRPPESRSGADAESGLNELRMFSSKLVAGQDLAGWLGELATHFNTEALTSISSYELVHSGIVKALLSLLTEGATEEEKLASRKEFMKAFMKSDGSSISPFAVLISKLQESLMRLEKFEVVTAGIPDANENPIEVMSGPVRLRLSSDDADGEGAEMIVSIPAISTVKTLDDYLRVRIGDRATGTPTGRFKSGSSLLNSSFPSFASFAASANNSSREEGNGQQKGDDSDEAGEGSSTTTAKAEASSSANESNKDKADAEDGKNSWEASESVVNRLEGYMTTNESNTAEESDSAATPAAESGNGTPTESPVAAQIRPRRASLSLDRLLRATGTLTPKQSYSSALQSAPRDWHVEFKSNGKIIPHDMTVVAALHKYAGTSVFARGSLDIPHTLKYSKAAGPAPVSESNALQYGEQFKDVPESLKEDEATFTVLQLLRILHKLNASVKELFAEDAEGAHLSPVPTTQFINSKLTSKLNRQLEEAVIVASSCVPYWGRDLTRHYPFLFPFETRRLFLQSTSFGHYRFLNKWQARNGRLGRRDSSSSYNSRSRGPILRNMRQKVRISRSQILLSAIRVMELYGSSQNVLEVEYFDEVGTGLGPTLEFYATVSREFAKKKLGMWRENESDPESEFAFGKHGLYARPLSEEYLKTEEGKKTLQMFKVLGQFVGRALIDSRLLDIKFNSTFFAARQESVVPSIAVMNAVDGQLASSLKLLEKFAEARAKVMSDKATTEEEKREILREYKIDNVSVEDLTLDFTLPGYPEYELVEGGMDKYVTMETVDEYVKLVLDATLGSGVEKQINAFREGFSTVFSFAAMSSFTPEELVILCGQVEEDWSLQTLCDSVKADHGFTMSSKTVQNLLEIMAEFTVDERRAFLQFVTGSPNLPIGGFKALLPTFTIVNKPSEPPFSPDDYLPSVMTCVNYLKMPNYSTKEKLRERVMKAVEEGSGAFLLS